MDLKNFAAQIHSTGFPLEHRIAVLLRNAGWSVIANKYYVDDLEETVREVDLVAYRVREVHHFSVYTTLIISCKKSEKNAWVLLSRQLNAADPNIDFEPFHAWSNDGPLVHVTTQSGWSETYFKRARQLGVRNVLDTPARDIFGFQEMDRENGKAHNDKAIFSAITSLMKAQAYELDVLPKRRKQPAIYQFNLINLVDADLVCLTFDDPAADPVPSSLDSALYVARYIINRQQQFARIHFVTANHFSDELPEYKKLHDANCKLFSEAYEGFFLNIFSERERWSILFEPFKAELKWSLWAALYKAKRKVEFKDIQPASFRVAENKLCIEAELTGEDISVLNSNDVLRKKTANALNKIYKYTGPFEFEQDIPF